MPLLSPVGKRSAGTRLLVAVMYLLLVIGAVTTVYPFLLMVGASVTSSAESGQPFTPVPRYLYDDDTLFAKWVEERYAGDTERISVLYHRRVGKVITDVSLPSRAEAKAAEAAVAAWDGIVSRLPETDRDAAFRGYATHPSPLHIRYEAYLRARFNGDIGRMNAAYLTQFSRFDQILVPVERGMTRSWRMPDTPRDRDYAAWKRTLPTTLKAPISVAALWSQFLREDTYRDDLPALQRAWGAAARFDAVALPRTAPQAPGARRSFEAFVRGRLPLRYVSVDPSSPDAAWAWEAFLARELAREPAAPRFPLPRTRADAESLKEREWRVWGDFVARAAPLAAISVRETPEAKYADAAENPGSLPPIRESDAAYVRAHLGAVRAEYLTRNYRVVLDYVLLHGSALGVTAAFCALAVLTALIVNPLCAYALSRFNLPSGYGILVFLLATMAFPAEVAMIPNFLLLRDLGLLNTMAALVLPGVANGFAIFLLKGFFDGLPTELYEAADLDGASEMTKLFRIALPMSTAILSVIALNAFLSAYGAFMFALIVCQNPRMWTIMVWLYQLQATAPPYLVMAGLVVAAVPTLLVFLFAQNVILKGILVPIEK